MMREEDASHSLGLEEDLGTAPNHGGSSVGMEQPIVAKKNDMPPVEENAIRHHGCFLGWRQVWALFQKNLLSKYRTPLPTLVEIFSPLAMMLVLVAAFGLSEISYRDATLYSRIQVDLPGPWLDLAVRATEFLNLDNTDLQDVASVSVERKLKDQWPLFQDMTREAPIGEKLRANEQFYDDFRRRLQFIGDDDFAVDENTTFTDDGTVFSLFNEANAQIQSLLQNPIPVPTFWQFVTVSRGLSSLIDADDLPEVLSNSEFGRQWGNLLTLGTLHLSPDIPIVHEFFDYLNTTYPVLVGDGALRVRMHDTEEQALEFINDNLNERTWALLDFSSYVDEEDFRYKIRMNYTTLPNTNLIVNFVNIGLSRDYQKYYLSGYLTLQRTLNEFAFSHLGNNDVNGNCDPDTSSIYSMPMPTAAFSQNAFFQAVGFLLGLTIAMAFLYPTSRSIKIMVEEKETRMKETLYILGVRPWAHWLSWVLTLFLLFFIITVLVTYTLTANILLHSNPAYIFAYIGFFSTSTIGFCFVVASFFSRSKLAAIVGPMALFATLLPRYVFFGSNRYEAVGGKMWASLLPATAFAFGADIVADYEYAEVGIQEWNASEGDYSFNTAVGFLFLDTLLYMFLGWYLDLVIPRRYGVARPWYFPFVPSYWKSCFGCFFPSGQSARHTGNNFFSQGGFTVGEADNSQELSDSQEELSDVEEVVSDVNLVPRVRIANLVKRYTKNPDVPPAVNHLNLSMYESQITCLLGHNGAGKTSTISVLTGLFPPTSGDCYIYNKSIVHNVNEARQSMGICPQHNVLFDRLTVSEHIRFFQKIKGIRPNKAGVRARAEEIGLGEYLSTTSSALSGGNKRKLSVAIALCGDPDFLLLDEPTSGMDPAARRACWELLRRKRAGRVTLLTTHFMDEAELLADRIAVMKEGRLQCCGSGLFLKNRFGLGYNLTVVLNNNLQPSGASDASASTDDTERMESGTAATTNQSTATATRAAAASVIENFLNDRIPGTQLVRKSAREVAFRFPQGTEHMFPDLFNELEEERDRLSIGAYGVSNTTLEEVFLQLAEDEKPALDESASAENRDAEEMEAAAPAETGVTQEDLQHLGPLRQIGLLYMKRFNAQKRDLKGTFFMIVLPVILCGLVLLILTVSLNLAGPPIEMSMNLYRSDPSGSDAPTDVLVSSGGGSSESETAFQDVRAAMQEDYPESVFVHQSVATSSNDLSQFMLDTYNDHDHNTRYGALVFDDTIKMTVEVGWGDIKTDLSNITGSLSDTGVFNLTGDAVANIDFGAFNISVSTLRDLADEALSAAGDFDFNATMLQSITQSVLDRIIGEDVTQIVRGVRSAWSDFLERFPEQDTETINATEATDAVVDLVTELVAILTDNAITNLTSTDLGSVVDAILDRDALFNRSLIENGWIEVVDGFVNAFNESSDVNATMVVMDVLDFLDESAMDSSEDRQSVPNSVLVVPLVLLDEALLLISMEDARNETATVSDMIDDLLDEIDMLGILDGLNLTIGASWFNISCLELVLQNVTLRTDSEVIFSIDEIDISLESLVDSVESLLPNTTDTYKYNVSSSASVIHNSSSPHAVGAFNQAYMEFLYKRCSMRPENARLVSVNHPLPLTDQQSIEIQTILSVLAGLFLLIPYCYIPAAFIVFLVKERVSKSKHLQLVSGVNMSAYWVSTYLWDLTLFFVLTVLIMLVFLIYGRNSAAVFVGDVESFFCSMLLTFGYGLSSLPFCYLLSRMFKNHSSAQIAIMVIMFITGFVAVNTYFVMSSIESTESIAEALRPFFRILPAYNVGEGFIQLSSNYWEREILFSDKRSFDWDVVGLNLFLIYILSIPYFMLLLLLEYSHDGGAGGMLGRALRKVKGSFESMSLWWHGVRKSGDGGSLALADGLDSGRGGDQDVEDERAYVQENADRLRGSASVLLVNLWKVYPPSVGMFGSLLSWVGRPLKYVLRCACFRQNQPRNRSATNDEEDEDDDDRSFLPKRAVRGVSTAVVEGETYGLLGVNGAGKTTSLGILTGDIAPTAGQAFVAGHDVTGAVPGGVSAARKNIGFCPQVDPLIDLMTGRETLSMFGRLRGIPKDRLNATVNELLDRLTLTPHADKVAESYSGGNKRKLSLGVALIGDPRVLFVDEASSGMDPAARRHMWSLIEQVSQQRSVVLTTHSMEEAEALCTRVGIMVKGQLLCLGSVQHLKSMYLDGYTIDVHCRAEADVDGIVDKLLTTSLPGSVLAERHGRFLKFEMPSMSSLGLGETFQRLQDVKETNAVENYSISQCSLEQVFIKLVTS